MAPFKTSIMLICFLINIVHAGFFEDELNCISQLQFAFKYRRESAMSCLRHAVEFYVEGQRIQVPEVFLLDENKPIPGGSQSDSDLITQRLPNESQSQSSFNWNRDDRSQVDEDFMAQWLQNELYNPISVNRNEDEEQQVVESSQYDSEGLFTQWFQDELKKEKISEHWDEDEGQHDAAERSLYWWEKENWSTSDSQQTIESSSQSSFDVNQNVATGHNVDMVNTQNSYPLNYAELYHIELENLITGIDVPNRMEFCNEFYQSYFEDCYVALKSFGDYAISSVKKAFKKYTLEGCKILASSDPTYVFIYHYMKIIISNCRVDEMLCIGQLQYAFQYRHDSAAQCLKYAIQYYIKDQHIPVPQYTLPSENQNNSDFTGQWFQNELNRQTSINLNQDDGPPVDEGGSQSDSEIFDQWFQNELNKKTISTSWDESDGQHVVEEHNPNWWENENWIGDEGQQIMIHENQNDASSSQSVTDISEYDFGISQYDIYNQGEMNKWLDSQNWVKNNEQQYIKSQKDYSLNYAEMYHKALESMITGTYVPNRKKFCSVVFSETNNLCYNALEPFGNNPAASVQTALNDYTLAYCKEKLLSDPNYVYIYSYMELIIKKCRVERSIKPSKFCELQIMAKYNLTERPNEI